MPSGDFWPTDYFVCNCTGYLTNGGRCCRSNVQMPTWTTTTTTPYSSPCWDGVHDYHPVPDQWAVNYLYCRKCGITKPLKVED